MENAGALPNFLVIGAAKCGTTGLCALLGRHPDVYMHPDKELDFFSYDEVYARGIEWYASRFSGTSGERAVGEGSPNYTKRKKRPHAAERIAQHLPEARLLYIVRHPLRRMESAWLHARRAGHRSLASFSATVRTYEEYVDTSDYLAQLDAYRSAVDAGRVLVLFFEDLVADAAATLVRACRHLGVDDTVRLPLDDAPRNPSLGRRVDRPALTRLRKSRPFRALNRAAPGFAAALVRPLQRTLTERPVWDDETRALVREALEARSRRFLVAHGKAEEYWDFGE